MFQTLVDVTPHVLWVYAAHDFRLVFVNAAFERVFGRSRATLESSPFAWLDCVHALDRERIRAELLRRAPDTAPTSLGDFRVTTASGEIRWIRSAIRSFAFVTDGVSANHWVETAHDFTSERQRAAAERHDRNLREALVDLLGSLVFTADLRGIVTWCNDALAKLYGAGAGGLVGRHVDEMLSRGPDSAGRFEAAVAMLPPKTRFDLGVRPFVTVDRGTREVTWGVVPIADDNTEEVTGFIGLGEDVTAKQQTERALRAGDARLGAVLRNLPDAPWLFSIDAGAFEYVTEAFEGLWGRPPPRGAGTAPILESWIHPADRMAVREVVAQIMSGENGTPRDLECRVIHPDGSMRWLSTRAVSVRVEGDAVAQVAGITLDITARREAESAKRATEERFRQMSETIGEGYLLLTTDRSRAFYGNAALGRILGIAREVLLENPMLYRQLIFPDDLARWDVYAAEGARRYDEGNLDETELDYRIVRPDGEVRSIHSRSYPVVESDGCIRSFVLVLRDVTVRRDAERALNESRELVRRMGETVRDVFFVVSVDRATLYYVNQAFEELWGRSREELYKTPGLFLEAMHPEDRVRIAPRIVAQRNELRPGEQTYEYRIVRPDETIRWVSVRTRPLREDDGSFHRIVGIATDVTARKAAELALEQRSAELERLVREKDVLLLEVHHRVKNNLQSITALMHLTASQAHRRSIRETIVEIEQRIQAMAFVHETLYRSSSLAEVDMESYILRLGEAVTRGDERGSRAIELRVNVRATSMDVERAMVCGLIVNELMNNALKHAFVDRVRGTIEVGLSEAEDGSYRLIVSDDGVGLPDDFNLEPEATLGLRLVSGLAGQLGGAARRIVGATSSIEIKFPRPA